MSDEGTFANKENPEHHEQNITNIYNMFFQNDKDFKENFIDTDKPNQKNEQLINNTGTDLESVPRKSLLQRYFSSMDEGSLRASIFAMSSLALGTGCLALPQKFGQMSFSCALLTIILAAAAAFWSLKIMIVASKKIGCDEYSKCVSLTFGKKAANFLDLVTMLYIFGILISYQVINDYATSDIFQEKFWGTWAVRFPVMYGICILLIPLCLLKDISKMKNASLVSIISLIYAILVIVIECPQYYKYYQINIYVESKPETHVNWFDFSNGFHLETLYFFRGAATVFFAYTCHVGAFPVYKTLQRNVSIRINKVFMRSILLDTVIYIIVGICGYLTQPYKTDDLIIYRDPIPEFNDLAMIIARLLIAFNLILSTPANYNAFRLSILSLFYSDLNKLEEDKSLNYKITIPTLIFSCLIGVLYDKISAYISILGGFCSVIIAFLIPGMLYIKNNDYPLTHYKNVLSIIAIGVLSFIGFTAGVISIIKIVKPDTI